MKYQVLACPICKLQTIERLLPDVQISARIDGERVVGGVAAYRCLTNGHIFFVREANLERFFGVNATVV